MQMSKDLARVIDECKIEMLSSKDSIVKLETEMLKTDQISSLKSSTQSVESNVKDKIRLYSKVVTKN